jgi:beta-glucosidase
VDVFFAAGRPAGPWGLAARDAQGTATVGSGTAFRPGGVVTVSTADAGAQENARTITWSGRGEGSFLVRGAAVDLNRQATGDMAVNLRLRTDRAPSRRVRLGAGKGSVDITGLMPKAGETATLKVKLSCLRAAGADLGAVEEPLILTTSGAAQVTILDLRLAPNTGDAVCPGG